MQPSQTEPSSFNQNFPVNEIMYFLLFYLCFSGVGCGPNKRSPVSNFSRPGRASVSVAELSNAVGQKTLDPLKAMASFAFFFFISFFSLFFFIMNSRIYWIFFFVFIFYFGRFKVYFFVVLLFYCGKGEFHTCFFIL